MLIKIVFYTTQTEECIVGSYDTAYSVCYALDNSDEVRHWCIPEGLCAPWYIPSLWDKMEDNMNEWVYS